MYKWSGIVMSVGAVTAVGVKALSDVNNAQGSTFYAYRRKLLTADPDENVRDVQNDKYVNQPWIKTVLDESYLNWKTIGLCALGGLVIGGALFKFHYMKRFIKCQPNKVLIIYSKYAGHRYDNGVMNEAYAGEGNGCYVYPFFEEYGFVEECDIPLKLQDFTVKTRDDQDLNISFDMIVGVGDTYAEVEYAASRLLNLSAKEIEEKAMELLRYGLVENLKTCNLSEIETHKESFNIYLQQQIGWYLKFVGLTVRKAPLLSYRTDDDKLHVIMHSLR